MSLTESPFDFQNISGYCSFVGKFDTKSLAFQVGAENGRKRMGVAHLLVCIYKSDIDLVDVIV